MVNMHSKSVDSVPEIVNSVVVILNAAVPCIHGARTHPIAIAPLPGGGAVH